MKLSSLIPHSPFVSCATIGLLIFSGCTSTKSADSASKDKEPVAADPAKPASPEAANPDLPPELRDADHFDPATTLDPKVVQESDFYQIKQSVEQNKEALEARWKEEDRIEANMKAQTKAEEQKKSDAAKKEEEERERLRQESIKNFEKNQEQKVIDEQNADDDVKKMPTIQKDEVEWKGLED